MKDSYEALELEVIAFEAEDVISASGGAGETPIDISGGED